MRILVADDERDLNNAIVGRLTDSGYSVDGCYDGESVFDYLAGADYDAVILDVMMPGADGFSVLSRMRNEGCDIPVIMLSARNSTDDKVLGLDCGANDYLAKPFEFKELEARLRNVLRKSSGNSTDVLTVADLTVDVKARRASRSGREIVLSAKEFAILECLIRNAGNVMSRERIENSVWNYDYSGGTNVIDVYIRYLRKKIDEGFDRKLIHKLGVRNSLMTQVEINADEVDYENGIFEVESDFTYNQRGIVSVVLAGDGRLLAGRYSASGMDLSAAKMTVPGESEEIISTEIDGKTISGMIF